MFGSPWRPQLSSLLFQSCVRDFGGLFYGVPLCDAVLARCWEPVRKCSAHRRLCQASERLFKLGMKTGVCVCVSGVFAHMPVRHSGLVSMFVLDSECAIFCMFGHEAL